MKIRQRAALGTESERETSHSLSIFQLSASYHRDVASMCACTGVIAFGI